MPLSLLLRPPPNPLASLLFCLLSADQVAQDFTDAFYDALFVAGETVQRAFEIALEHVKSVTNAAASFVLLPQGESPLTPQTPADTVDVADNAATGVGAGDGTQAVALGIAASKHCSASPKRERTKKC